MEDKLDKIIELLEAIKAQGEPGEVTYNITQRISPTSWSEEEVARAASRYLPHRR